MVHSDFGSGELKISTTKSLSESYSSDKYGGVDGTSRFRKHRNPFLKK